MGRDFLPRGDGKLVQWSRNFSRRLNESPESYHVPPERAAAYAVLDDAFAAAHQAATAPGTRTCSTVAEKNEARARLKLAARFLAKFISGCVENGPEKRAALGLLVRTGGSPIPKPHDAPVMEIVSADGWRIVAQLRHAGSGRRGMGPHNVGATVWTHVGDAPPSDLKLWKLTLFTSRTRFTLNLPATLPAGSRVWICARWQNPKAQSGPAGAGVGLMIGGGVPTLPSPAAALRRAA